MLKPATKQAFDLLMNGAICMSRIEAAGIRINTEYLKKAIDDITVQIAEMDHAIHTDPAYKLWTKIYGNSMKLGSRQQLGHIIFDQMGHKRNPHMDGRNNAASFEHLKLPFVRNWQDVERLKKAKSTYLENLLRECVDGFIHPFFDLHTVESYRSSSSKPNLQNQPVRNKDISRIIRTCMVPRSDDYVFLEPDLETHEVRISYCHNKDKKLKYDILHGDMHTDRAMDLYILTKEQLGPVDKDPGKIVRYCAKNKFVFAQFYGSYFAQCAPELWDAIAIFDLKRSDGMSLFKHLEMKGITKLGECNPDLSPVEGTFEYHVKEVERNMWEDNYTVYNQWKKDWWESYQRDGGINYKTGFKLEGIFRRNQILCDPIQGAAFHCLLWTVTQVEKEMRKKKMRSKIVNQIHDSMLIDAHKNEVEDVIKIVGRTILKDLPKYWDWICIPLGLGWDICTKNWFEKKPLELPFVMPV